VGDATDISGTRLSAGTLARLYRAFMGARAALGLSLLATQALAGLMGGKLQGPAWWLSLFYAVQALLGWLLPKLRGPQGRPQRLGPTQWWLSVGVDLLVFSALHALDPAGLSYGALFVMPALMAGTLLSRLRALGASAVASLVLLGVALWSVLLGLDGALRLTQAGLLGSGLFVISLLANELTSRLAREEQAARGSLEYARQQAELNRLVIDEMQEGVLVADRRGLVRAANPAARQLLAEGAQLHAPSFNLDAVPAWRPLRQALELAFERRDWPEAGRDLSLDFSAALQRSLRVRMRFTSRPIDGEDLCVLFIEDNRKLLARTRQEKLAAMGRVSAGIAHEIRNPLTAIAQANALLAEDLAEQPRLQPLTRMVASNVARLKRIVDDVMEVAPGAPAQAQPLELLSLLSECCADWARTQQLPEGEASPLRVQLASTAALWISFEPDHLRRVLINLLDNGLRHARPGPAHLTVQLRVQDENWVRLSVLSLGEPIPPEVERHLFEPFFSTRARGSGLGLYICRELCERYGARIDYQRQMESGLNEFRLQLRRCEASMPLPERA
jgi:two-component system sensor histidine kinase PilS (NtrC family)